MLRSVGPRARPVQDALLARLEVDRDSSSELNNETGAPSAGAPRSWKSYCGQGRWTHKRGWAATTVGRVGSPGLLLGNIGRCVKAILERPEYDQPVPPGSTT